MSTQCLLVDDEPLAISLLQKHIEQLDSFEIAGTCNNAVKALEYLNKHKIDLLFLDIKMPKISGIELLKTLKNPPKVIITTAYREYAVDGYDLDIIDYLLKPITFDRFFKAVERYLRVSNKILPELLHSSENKFIYVKSRNKFFKLDINDILYIESLKDYIKVFTREKDIVAKYRISDFEKELITKGFLRIHRSFIVNIKNITAFTATDIEIGKTEIPIGAGYKELVFKTLNP
ncbi:LytR/AlgR family response regulator transcription factor [Chitinophagaceae bacterium LWZ2-11]